MQIKWLQERNRDSIEGPGVEWFDQFCKSKTQSFPTEQVPVSAYGGSLKNLKDLKATPSVPASMADTAPLKPPMLWKRNLSTPFRCASQAIRGGSAAAGARCGHFGHEQQWEDTATFRFGAKEVDKTHVDGVVVARLLIEHGADVSASDKDDRTPLHFAANQGSEEVARMLMGRGAHLQWRSNGGATPEDVATMRGHLHIAAMLKAEAVRRDQCMAFAMGQQERLGAGSSVRGLDAEVVRMVLAEV